MCITWFFLGCVQPETVCSAGSVFLEGKDVGGTVFVFVWMCRCRCWGWGAFVLCCCVYPIPVYLTRYLTSSFFILIPFLARTQGSRIHSHSFFLFPFSLYSAVHKLLFSLFCAAGTFLSKWLSFSFKLVWADLPCNKISTCWTEWHAIQHDCNSLKLSRMCCHCLAVCTAHYVSPQKLQHTALPADSLVVFQNNMFTYSQMFIIHFGMLLLRYTCLPLCV